MVLSIDVEKERISLGVKQLDGDTFSAYTSMNDKGAIVTGTVKAVDAKGATVTLDTDVEGYIKAADISKEKVSDATEVLKEGDSVEAVIVNVDRKNRVIGLSIKAKDAGEQVEAAPKAKADSAANAGTTNLGALLKAKLDSKNNE